MSSKFINQILNNFLKYSKLYLPLSEYKDGENKFFIIKDSSKLIITTQEPDKPYLIIDEPYLLRSLIYTGFREIYIDSTPINKKDLIILIGGIDHLKNNYTRSEILLNINYPALAYFSSEISKNDIIFSIALKKLGLLEESIEILENMNNEESKITLARIYREENKLKKSLEVLNQINSKEFEIQKNIEYGWLHLKTKKPQNSIKIFEYYKDIENSSIKQDVLFGLGLSMIELSPQNISDVIKIFQQAIELEGFSKREIMENLASLYIELNDLTSALEIYKEVYRLTSDINLIPKILDISQKLNNELIFLDELTLFKLDEAKKFFENKNIKRSDLKIIKPEESIAFNQNYSEQQEVILKPEDIVKTSIKLSKTSTTIKREEYVDLMTKEMKFEKTDEISELAFAFIREIEEQSSKKIPFNLEGIDEIERKIRIITMTDLKEDEIINFLTKASYFFIYIIRERFKAKIKIINELDIWATTATIKNKNNIEILTYPAARLWNFKWSNIKPPHGYLRSYIEYLNSFMNQEAEPPYGKIAISKGFKSDDQKIFDAQIEHKKILEIAKDIEETSYLSANSSLLPKFEKELRKYFKPTIPPTSDGWKILRCFGHIFLEMIIKDFSPLWYCVERNDGLWSFMLSNKTFIFPIGKTYKAALLGESLQEYYQILNKNKLK